MAKQTMMAGRWWPWVGAVLVVALVAAVYWPALNAGFVWDGISLFQQHSTLYTDAWWDFLFTGFNEWTLYFRPLGVALFVLKARLFGGDAAALHALSLAVVLVNVGLLIAVARAATPARWRLRTPMALLAGLLYGLHPMLVATVVWISCHDQTMVSLILAALLASLCIRQVWLRAAVVSLCFFAAALIKESAVALPVFVVLLDWLRGVDHDLSLVARFRNLLRGNWPVYLCLFVAGLLYLLLRQWALDAAIPDVVTATRLPDLAHLDQIAWLYLKYWGITLGIASELNPLHAVDSVVFGQSLALLALRIAAMLGVLAVGLLVFSRRFVATGVVVVAVSIYLVPFLGILPVTFDQSLYHERYAIGAIAMLCVLLPAIVHEWLPLLGKLPLLVKCLPLVPLVWLALAIPNIRATIPLWSSNVALWTWAVQGNPGHLKARANLINAYLVEGRYDEAAAATRDVLADKLDCALCFVNGLTVAVRLGDVGLVRQMISKLQGSAELKQDPRMQHFYYRALGRLELRRAHPAKAIGLLQLSIAREDLEPLSHILLAEALMAAGKYDAAREQARLAVGMAAPASRAQAKLTAARILAGEAVYGGSLEAMHGR